MLFVTIKFITIFLPYYNLSFVMLCHTIFFHYYVLIELPIKYSSIKRYRANKKCLLKYLPKQTNKIAIM